MIKKIRSISDWIKDSGSWEFRFLNRVRSPLFSNDREMKLYLKINSKIKQLKNHDRISATITINDKNSIKFDSTIEIRGKHRSTLPMLGVTFASIPSDFDSSYHLILLEHDSSIKYQPINEMGNTSASDMFWMEYFSYKAISMLTDCSLDCKLCNIILDSNDINIKTKAILIESFDSIITRIGSIYKYQQNCKLEICDLNTLKLIELYIGNLDYSIGVEKEHLIGHNVLLCRKKEDIILIPYDFQFLVFTATEYGAYKLFNTKEFIQVAKQDIEDLFPLPDHISPLISLANAIPKLNLLCTILPLSDSVKSERIKFSNELLAFIQNYISNKKGGKQYL